MSPARESQKSNMSTARVCQQPNRRKMTKQEAARKLARLAEESMERKGLSEGKKMAKVQQFVEYVDAVNARRAK